MVSGIYNIHKADLMNGEVDLEADTIKVALMNTSHSFTATDNTWASISANEVTGTGYTAGGIALANKAVTQAATTKWDADDIAYETITLTAYHAVIYDSTTGNLIASHDFGGGQTMTGVTFNINWNASGIETIA